VRALLSGPREFGVRVEHALAFRRIIRQLDQQLVRGKEKM